MGDDVWGSVKNSERIVNAARETAVYLKSQNDVVIRQRAAWPLGHFHAFASGRKRVRRTSAVIGLSQAAKCFGRRNFERLNRIDA